MKRPLLIVVDDERDMAEFVEEVGESIGFEVLIATSAREFQEICASRRPSGIVMDIVMPDMDGNELLQWMSEKGYTTPVIIMSGYGGRYVGMAEELGTARGALVVGSLVKPIRADDLESMLQEILDSLD